jgi:hypothetical protein
MWPFKSPSRELVAEVFTLRQRVEALEEQQLKREIEWRETKTQVLRHLQRVQAIEGARREKEESAEGEHRPDVRHIIAAKFPTTRQG